MKNLYNEKLKHRYNYIVGILIIIMFVSLYFIFIDKDVMSKSEVKSIIIEIDNVYDIVITNDNYVIGNNVYYTVHSNSSKNEINNDKFLVKNKTYYRVNTGYYTIDNEEIWVARYCIDKTSKEIYIEFRDNPKHLIKYSDYNENIDYALSIINNYIHSDIYNIEIMVEDDIYTIHIYETITNEDESHIATIGWYTFDTNTKEVKDIMSGEILK